MRFTRLSLCSFALAMFVAAGAAEAQQTAAALAGIWEGSYMPKAAYGKGSARSRELGSTRGTTKLPVLLTINVDAEGKVSGTWTGTAQQGAQPIEIAMDGDVIRVTNPATMSSWEGKLSKDGSKLEGTWRGKTFSGDSTAPLVLRRSDQ